MKIEYLALEDPYLHADQTISGAGFGGCVVDVCTQRVKRHTAFTIPLGTRNLGTAQAATNLHFDPFCSLAHGILHNPLHGAAEHHTALQLLRNAIGYQLRIEVRLTDLFDVDVHGHTHL